MADISPVPLQKVKTFFYAENLRKLDLRQYDALRQSDNEAMVENLLRCVSGFFA